MRVFFTSVCIAILHALYNQIIYYPMKKFTILSLFAAFLLVGVTANAQEQGDIRVGAGLALGTKAAIDESGSKLGLGINVGGEYLITDQISIAPSYTYFFESSVTVDSGFGTFEAKQQLSALNIDARYYFSDNGLYGLAGFSNLSADGGGSEAGLNIGAGIMYPMSDSMFLNGQVKYQTPGEGQLVINAGVAFAF